LKLPNVVSRRTDPAMLARIFSADDHSSYLAKIFFLVMFSNFGNILLFFGGTQFLCFYLFVGNRLFSCNKLKLGKLQLEGECRNSKLIF